MVTGANRGIGRAVAVAYAEAGYAVAVTARDPATCADTVAEIESRDGTAVALACDITAEASVTSMAEEVLDRLGPVHTVIANAGVGGPTAPLHEIDLAADLDGVFPSPLGHVVDASEIAAACVFLSSDAPASITGEDLNVNAGVAM